MNKPYRGLWALLLTALVFFTVLSLKTDGIKLGGFEIKTSSFAQSMKSIFTGGDSTAIDSLDANGRLPNGRHPKGWRAPVDTTAQTILFIGDSMLEGLGPRLAAYCDVSGDTLIEVIWYSSSTLYWAQSGRLTELINKFHPTYVMVCLGANELYVPDIRNARKPFVKKILAEIGNLPYLWIGPPNWDTDTGINDLLADNLDEGCFYVSAKDKFERSRDGAHPTRASAALWMDRVIKWMDGNAAYPLRFNHPGDTVGRASRIVVYQPPA